MGGPGRDPRLAPASAAVGVGGAEGDPGRGAEPGVAAGVRGAAFTSLLVGPLGVLDDLHRDKALDGLAGELVVGHQSLFACPKR